MVTRGAPKAMAASKASSVVMRPDSTKRAVTGMKRKTWTASVIFSLVVPYSAGSAQIEIMNYDPVDTDYSTYRVPDANRFSYAVLVTAANGRKAFLAGDIDDYSQGWSLGGGDETKITRPCAMSTS